MGLIKAAVGAIGTTFNEQWQDLIQCEDMNGNILMVKKTTSTGQISKGSSLPTRWCSPVWARPTRR